MTLYERERDRDLFISSFHFRVAACTWSTWFYFQIMIVLCKCVVDYCWIIFRAVDFSVVLDNFIFLCIVMYVCKRMQALFIRKHSDKNPSHN